MIINVEIMPPDKTNIERASRLNTKTTYLKWYNDNFSETEDTIPNDFIEKISKMSRWEIAVAINKMTVAEVEAVSKYLRKNQENK